MVEEQYNQGNSIFDAESVVDREINAYEIIEDEDNNCNITIIDDEFGINDAIKKVMERYPEGTELSILEVFELMDEPVETIGKKRSRIKQINRKDT